MLGENVDASKANKELIEQMIQIVQSKLTSNKLVISICGESGSGKSVTTAALNAGLENQGINSLILQMDDYFKLPPESNRLNRRKSLDNVGPHEVDLEKLDEVIQSILSGAKALTVPQVDYHANDKGEAEFLIPQDLKVIIVEGTYVSLLKTPELRFFIQRTYEDTHLHRTARSREPQTDFLLEVLAIEHGIVQEFYASADYIIDKNFNLKKL